MAELSPFVQTVGAPILRVCQTCKFCTPKQAEGPIGLFCENPNVIVPGFKEDYERIGQVPASSSSPTSIFWAVLKHCGEERKYWERA